MKSFFELRNFVGLIVSESGARWHHLKRLRSPDPNRAMITAARQEITEAGKFLTWLHETHGIAIAELRQTHVDDYLAEGPSTRKHPELPPLALPHPGPRRTCHHPYRKALTNPLLTQQQRIQLVANCLTFEDVALSTRIAGLIQLL